MKIVALLASVILFGGCNAQITVTSSITTVLEGFNASVTCPYEIHGKPDSVTVEFTTKSNGSRLGLCLVDDFDAKGAAQLSNIATRRGINCDGGILRIPATKWKDNQEFGDLVCLIHAPPFKSMNVTITLKVVGIRFDDEADVYVSGRNGDTVELNCTVMSKSKPEFSWWKSLGNREQKIPGGDSSVQVDNYTFCGSIKVGPLDETSSLYKYVCNAEAQGTTVTKTFIMPSVFAAQVSNTSYTIPLAFAVAVVAGIAFFLQKKGYTLEYFGRKFKRDSESRVLTTDRSPRPSRLPSRGGAGPGRQSGKGRDSRKSTGSRKSDNPQPRAGATDLETDQPVIKEVLTEDTD